MAFGVKLSKKSMAEKKVVTFGGQIARVVDLFCGLGGLTHGFVRRNFDVAVGIDIDKTCKYAYEANNNAEFWPKSVDLITQADLQEIYGHDTIRILVGCAPCQDVSRYNRNSVELASKYRLLEPFARLVQETRPSVVSMENVPTLRPHGAYDVFVNTLEAAGYHVWADEIYCPDYGIAQTRTRLVVLASLLGDIEMIPPTHMPENYTTLQQIIGNLSEIQAGESCPDDRIHTASRLTDINLRRIRATREGGGWADWEDDLVLECHKKDTGQSYPSVYGRMCWNGLAPTMTTQCNGLGNGRFGHPDQDRAISLREAALIQSFPIEYQFVEEGKPVVIKTLARHIGNAVPVLLGEKIAESIENHLVEHCGESHYVNIPIRTVD